MKYTDMITISATARRHIHRYCCPSVQPPGTNCDPALQRRKIGIANARYRPMTPTETTA